MKNFFQINKVTNIVLFSFSFSTLLFLFSFSLYFVNAQEETITIVPGSSDPDRYRFDKEGEYIFQSSKYNWMKGKIIVTDDIKTIKESMENDIDLYISWTPSSLIKQGEKILFKIIFVDEKSERNQ